MVVTVLVLVGHCGCGRESYEYMYARPWSRVVDFYAELVRTGAGAAGLADLFGKDEVRRNDIIIF